MHASLAAILAAGVDLAHEIPGGSSTIRSGTTTSPCAMGPIPNPQVALSSILAVGRFSLRPPPEATAAAIRGWIRHRHGGCRRGLRPVVCPCNAGHCWSKSAAQQARTAVRKLGLVGEPEEALELTGEVWRRRGPRSTPRKRTTAGLAAGSKGRATLQASSGCKMSGPRSARS